MLIVRISNAGSGGVGETAFTIKDGQLNPISCTAYDGSMGDASNLIGKYGVTDIFDLKNPSQSMFITLNSSSIIDFKCYDTDENLIDASADIEISEDWATGKQNLNVWLGKEVV